MMREVLEKKCLKIKESWPNLQLPKSKIKKLVASAAECWLSVTKSQAWAISAVFISVFMF